VTDQALSREGAAFLSACAAGLSIEAAVTAALETQARVDLSTLINQLLQAGAFAAVQPANFEDA
jgi:tagatose-1,6-bisphosphate aldolase non-catalytic subunit AgaZ/GatZ